MNVISVTDFKVDAVNWRSETVFSTIAEPESCSSKSSGIGGIQCRRKEIKSLGATLVRRDEY